MTPLQSLHNLLPSALASLSFVYVYLPVCLLAYHLLPKKLRPAALLIESLVFYALVQPGFFALILLSALADFFLTQGLAVTRRRLWRCAFLWICISKNLFLICYFGVIAQIGEAAAPMGLLVVCLSGIDAALAAYREPGLSPRGFIRIMLYILFFPRLYAGPLLTPEDFCRELDKSAFDARKIALGFGRFAEGAFKYAVLGYNLFLLYISVSAVPDGQASVLSAWIFVLSFALALYFTISGLADMARGISGMFCTDLPQNFYYPYQSRSVTDFYERFNITAGAFFRRAVQRPLSPGKYDPLADSLNILLAGMLWGVWFGVRVNYGVWGAFIAVFMIMEKYLYPRLLNALPTLFQRGYSLCVALVGFTIFAGDSLSQSYMYFMRMFGFASRSEQLFNDRILYILSSNWVLLAVSCLLATNIISLFTGYMRKSRPVASGIIFTAADACVLAAFTAVVLGGGRL